MLASRASASFHSQVVVIGAGVVGLAVTRALAKAGKEVLLLEKASHICTETSSRNSEVIHAGLYYPPDSAKAKFCVEGKQSLYQYCEERGIAHRRCGKLVVATSKRQLAEELPFLRDQAFRNDVTDIRLLSREDIQVLEPAVECFGGLFSPSTGVLDSHSFYTNLLADCEDGGATVVLHSEVNGADLVDGKLCLSADGALLSADTIVNCAGLHAYEVASKLHRRESEHDPPTPPACPWQPPRHFFAKGTYFRLDGTSPFRHLIYPVPEPGGLGIHATIDWSGTGTKFGPDVEWLDSDTRPGDINYDPDPAAVDKFAVAIEKYYPELPRERLQPDYVGVRPKLRHPSIVPISTCTPSTPSKNVAFDDFLIVEKTVAKSQIFHLFGIESPGLTSSLGIADYVKRAIG